MSEKYKFHDPDGIYHVTLTVVNWIDLFTRKEYKYEVIDSLKFCQKNKGLIIHAWVIMPSHIHLIISSNGDSLSRILRDMKKFLTKKIITIINTIPESRKDWLLDAFASSGSKIKRVKQYKLWQDGNHPIHLDTAEFMEQRLDYLHNNPVEAEIVDEPEYYWYSSARDYSGLKGLIEVEFIQ